MNCQLLFAMLEQNDDVHVNDDGLQQKKQKTNKKTFFGTGELAQLVELPLSGLEI